MTPERAPKVVKTTKTHDELIPEEFLLTCPCCDNAFFATFQVWDFKNGPSIVYKSVRKLTKDEELALSIAVSDELLQWNISVAQAEATHDAPEKRGTKP